MEITTAVLIFFLCRDSDIYLHIHMDLDNSRLVIVLSLQDSNSLHKDYGLNSNWRIHL